MSKVTPEVQEILDANNYTLEMDKSLEIFSDGEVIFSITKNGSKYSVNHLIGEVISEEIDDLSNLGRGFYGVARKVGAKGFLSKLSVQNLVDFGDYVKKNFPK